MIKTFSICLNMKTTLGFETFGRYFLGNDRDFAYRLFASLHGSDSVREEDALQMDLMETTDGLPLNIRVLNCTLDELTTNGRIITKEIFKQLNLRTMDS